MALPPCHCLFQFHVANGKLSDFVHTFGDAHIYSNHFEQVKEQLSREPMPLPRLKLNKEVTSIYDFTYDDVKIFGYKAHPHIAGKVAV